MMRKCALRLTAEVGSVPGGICWMCMAVPLVSAMNAPLLTVVWIVLWGSNWILMVVLTVPVSNQQVLQSINPGRSISAE